VEIIADNENKITGTVMLTGKVTNVKKAPGGVLSFVRYPIVWIFVILILGFVTFMILKRTHKKSFFGHIFFKKKGERKKPRNKDSIINSKNKAELSLSIKGDKQNVSLICLKIKNLKEIESSKGKEQTKNPKEKSKEANAKETLQKIVDLAEEEKAATYENQDNIFFILAPTKTRTFKNEKAAVNIAKKIEDVLQNHNKLFRQKIEFGISLNYGTIIAKQEKTALKFMSMGTLITSAKKIASLSEEEILLGEKIKEKLISDIKSENKDKWFVNVFTINELYNKEAIKNFISYFI